MQLNRNWNSIEGKDDVAVASENHSVYSNMLEYFLERLEVTWVTIKPNIRWLAIFGLLTHPLFLLVNNIQGNGDDSLLLRFVAVVACLLALKLPSFERLYGVRVASGLSVCIVFFTLPFFFLWVLLANSIDGGIGLNELGSRQTQCALAIMATALLIYDRVVLGVGLLVCFVLVCGIFYGEFGLPRLHHALSVALTQAPFWIFSIFAGTYFNRNRAVVEREKYKTLSAAGGYLAHELRTPLAGASLKLHGLKKYLEEQNRNLPLDDTPKKVDRSELDSAFVRASSLAGASIGDIVYANELIDMFLVRAGVTSSTVQAKTRFLVSACAYEALQRYPFPSSRQRNCTQLVIESDFVIDGPFLLFTHVLLNLLKNALAYTVSQKRPEVLVRIHAEEGLGYIDVIDNGTGIARGDRAKIFESFYTTSEAGEGTGIGLNYCKSVVSEMGGTLRVTSNPNVETVFRIRFAVPQ